MAKRPTKAQRDRWERVRELGCPVADPAHKGYIQIHHAGTGGGGRKDHDKVFPLCVEHHTGSRGIDGGVISKRGWQQLHGSEESFLLWVAEQLGEVCG